MTHLVQQVPSDILQQIFAEVVNDESEALFRRASTLVSCSQVCNQWRNAALSNTRSWAQIIDFNRNSTTWINELLKRSHPHGIEFGSDGRAGPVLAKNIDSNKITLLLSHASRVRTFYFRIDPQDSVHTVANNLIHTLFELPLPSLKCLYVTSYEVEVPQTLRTFLHGNAPQLCRLCIPSMGCLRLLLSDVLLPSLEELYVWQVGSWLNVQEWVEILSIQTPNLKRLHLDYAIEEEEPDGSTMHTNNETSDLLPNLEEISIYVGQIGLCINLINALRPPSTCAIKINGDSWEGEVENDMHLLSSLIESRVQTWSSEIPNRFLEIGYEIHQMPSEYKAEITISNRFETSDKRLLPVTQNLKIPTQSIARLDPSLFIDATFHAYSGMMYEHVTSILSIFQKMEGTFATTTTLRICHCGNSKLLDPYGPNYHELDPLGLPIFWDGLFARLSSIEVLMLSGDALFPIIPILMQDSSTITPRFPRLSSLVLEIYGQKADEAVQGSYFSITQAFLLHRKKQGFPIRTVYLLVSNANSDPINGLFGNLCDLVVINFAEGAALFTFPHIMHWYQTFNESFRP